MLIRVHMLTHMYTLLNLWLNKLSTLYLINRCNGKVYFNKFPRH